MLKYSGFELAHNNMAKQLKDSQTYIAIFDPRNEINLKLKTIKNDLYRKVDAPLTNVLNNKMYNLIKC